MLLAPTVDVICANLEKALMIPPKITLSWISYIYIIKGENGNSQWYQSQYNNNKKNSKNQCISFEKS